MKITIPDFELDRLILMSVNLLRAAKTSAGEFEKYPVYEDVDKYLEKLSGNGKTGQYAAYFEMQAFLMCAHVVRIDTLVIDGVTYVEAVMNIDMNKGYRLEESVGEITKAVVKVIKFIDALKPILTTIPTIEMIVDYFEDRLKLLGMRLKEIHKKD